jgi:acyl carrier protein
MAHDTPLDREVLERLAQIVAGSLRIDAQRVTEDAYLDELGAESLDLAEITMEVEEEFGILLPEKSILQAAEEVVGEGVLVVDGRLTERGLRLLGARLPGLESADSTNLSVRDVNHLLLRVGAWVRMIARLMEHTPRACPRCGLAFGKQVAGRLTCKGCGLEHDIRSGDELNREWVQRYCLEELPEPPVSSAP